MRIISDPNYSFTQSFGQCPHFKSHFLSTDISPYFSLDIGYNVGFKNSSAEGFMVNPNIGVAFRVSDTNAVTFSVGYQGNSLVVVDYNEYGRVISEKRKLIGAVNLKLGVAF